MTQEPVSLTTSDLYFHRTVSETPNPEYDLHCHPYYEVFYLLRGDVSYRIEGAEYALSPGMLLLMPPGAFHGVRILSGRPYDRIAIHFLPGVLTGEAAHVLLTPFRAGGACITCAEEYRIEEYLSSVLFCASMPESLRNVALRPRLEALMAQICLLDQCTPADEPAEPALPPVSEIIDHLNRHLSDPTTLDDLSTRFFISKNQLNRVFRKATGTTVMSYLSHKRIALAQQLLLDGTSASEAALRAGFGDYSTFYRTYRRLSGHSPAEAQKLNIL